MRCKISLESRIIDLLLLQFQNTMDVKQSDTAIAGILLFNCAQEGNVVKLKEILSKGGPLHSDNVGTTALHCAVIGNQLESCEILLRSAISVDARTKVDRTPLHLAAYHGHERIVELLLTKNCDVDPLDMFLMTPLHWAVENRYPDIVRLLLEKGADPYALSKFNKTPRSIAETEELAEIVHIFDMFTQGYTDTNESTVSLVLETKARVDPLLIEEHEDYEREDEDDVELDTMSIFEEDDVVDVIPSTADMDSVDITLEEAEEPMRKRIKVEPDQGRDECFSNLHDTMNQLGNIRGLKPADATTLKILQNIGISISEDHDPTIISNVLQSGRKIVLSEAGKYILNQTKANDESNFPLKPPKQEHVQRRSSPLVPVSRMAKNRMIRPCPASSDHSSLVKRSRVTDMERELRQASNTTSESSARLSLSVSGFNRCIIIHRVT